MSSADLWGETFLWILSPSGFLWRKTSLHLLTSLLGGALSSLGLRQEVIPNIQGTLSPSSWRTKRFFWTELAESLWPCLKDVEPHPLVPSSGETQLHQELLPKLTINPIVNHWRHSQYKKTHRIKGQCHPTELYFSTEKGLLLTSQIGCHP